MRNIYAVFFLILLAPTIFGASVHDVVQDTNVQTNTVPPTSNTTNTNMTLLLKQQSTIMEQQQALIEKLDSTLKQQIADNHALADYVQDQLRSFNTRLLAVELGAVILTSALAILWTIFRVRGV